MYIFLFFTCLGISNAKCTCNREKRSEYLEGDLDMANIIDNNHNHADTIYDLDVLAELDSELENLEQRHENTQEGKKHATGINTGHGHRMPRYLVGQK